MSNQAEQALLPYDEDPATEGQRIIARTKLFIEEKDKSNVTLQAAIKRQQVVWEELRNAISEQIGEVGRIIAHVREALRDNKNLKTTLVEANHELQKQEHFNEQMKTTVQNATKQQEGTMTELQRITKGFKRDREGGFIEGAGEFVIAQGFAPGRRKNAKAGEFLTPKTLLRYMEEWREALGKPPVYDFTPMTEGYIPFFILKDGSVHVPGGFDRSNIRNKIRWTYKRKGSMCTLNPAVCENIYAPAVAARLDMITKTNDTSRDMTHLAFVLNKEK